MSETRGDPVGLLRERRLRVTPQRRAILAAFRDRPDEHLSADEVHARASRAVPELGRGTVYATLAELTELGLIAAVGSPEPVRYEVNVSSHDHFRCRLCLRLYDVELGGSAMASPGLLGDEFLVEHVAISAEGLCPHCRGYRRGLEAGAAAVGAEQQIDDELLSTLACARHAGPFGEVVIAATPDGAARIAFPEHADYPRLSSRARHRTGSRAARRHASELAATLDRYFGGSTDPSEGVIDWLGAEQATSGTLEATRGIPYGDSLSYERLGGDADVDGYRRGYAVGANPLPLLLPCHRVSCGSDRPEIWVGGVDRLGGLHRFEAETLDAA
jgi:Fe2+ or Zn2+ uptake regulation protein/O6-methylguanine-DNA--protein-cysteine methyltransferase